MKITLENNTSVYEVLADGAISNSTFGEGRLIPAIIIGINNNLPLKESIEIHQKIPSGDAEYCWLKQNTFFKVKKMQLFVHLIKPIETKFRIQFDLYKHYSIIDAIINSRGLIIQNGNQGQKVSETIDKGLILEIPDLDFDKIWSNLLEKTLIDINRKKKINKKDAKTLAMKHMANMKEMWKIRR